MSVKAAIEFVDGGYAEYDEELGMLADVTGSYMKARLVNADRWAAQ